MVRRGGGGPNEQPLVSHDRLPVVIIAVEEEVDRREYAADARWRKNPGEKSRLGSGSTDGGRVPLLPPLPNGEADRELRGGPGDAPGPLERREGEGEVLLAAEDVVALFDCRISTGEDPPLVGGRGEFSR